ncbi:MAG: hypothetical protein U0Q16_38055 [Bryobacteraceae bacterium]
MRLISLVLLPPALFSQTPEQSITSFYSTYKDLGFFGLPDSSQLAKLAPYLSTGLQALLQRAQSEQARCTKAYPDDVPPWSEGSLFTSNFEGFTAFHTGQRTASRVALEFDYTENGKTFHWQDQIQVVKERGNWVIDDIRFRRPNGFTSGYGSSLRKSLAATGCRIKPAPTKPTRSTPATSQTAPAER